MFVLREETHGGDTGSGHEEPGSDEEHVRFPLLNDAPLHRFNINTISQSATHVNPEDIEGTHACSFDRYHLTADEKPSEHAPALTTESPRDTICT